MKPICKNLRLAKRNAQKHLCSWIRKNGRFQLWFSVTWCVLTALLVFTFLGWLWVAPPEGQTKQSWLDRFLIIWQIDAPSNNLDIVKVALTAIGGLGGIVYLVIRYRERTDAEEELIRKEQETADRRLNDAVQQLGSESPQVRIAGVYAIADVADTYLGHYKQRAVDVLAGYLRTDRGSKEEGTFKDAAVESTILQIFSDHLKKNWRDRQGNVQVVSDEQLWSDCHIDLHGALIHETVDFSSVVIKKLIAQGRSFNLRSTLVLQCS